jgi:hypothetical protein
MVLVVELVVEPVVLGGAAAWWRGWWEATAAGVHPVKATLTKRQAPARPNRPTGLRPGEEIATTIT